MLELNKVVNIANYEKADEYIKEHTTSFGDVFIPASES